jgi:glycosyltransferase involved in cell wall biosynthesis
VNAAPPLVSVVVPVRNGAAYLRAALASLLGQSRPPDEVVVADDGSTDETAEIAAAAGPGVRVLAGPFGGAAAARNAGVAAARGDLLAFLDHDDVWTDGRLERHLAVLSREPAVDLVLGLTQRARDEGGRLVPTGPPAAEPSLGAILVTRRAFERVGPLDAAKTFDEDVDWFLRAREARVPARLDRAVAQVYRRHATNATNQRAADVRGFFEALRDSIARRRGADGAVRALSGWPVEDAP